MTRTRRPILVAVVGLALAGSACGRGGGADDLLSASAEGRRKIPSCGSYDASASEITAEGRAARDCFLDAVRQDREAEVTITATSIEGDPITTIYRWLGPDSFEVFVDASADTFAAVKLLHQQCTSVTEEGAGLAAGGCVTVG